MINVNFKKITGFPANEEKIRLLVNRKNQWCAKQSSCI